MALLALTSFHKAAAATTNVDFTIGIADAVLVTATCSSGLTLTLADGSTTVALGNVLIGTLVPIRCTKAVFAAGSVVALQIN